MKRVVIAVVLLFCLCASVFAQEGKHEVSIQGSGFFGKESTNAGMTQKSTQSGGLVASYRYNLSKSFSVEATYDYFSNSQKYIKSTAFSQLQTNVNAVSGNLVYKLPVRWTFKPYVLAGGGAIVFDPRNNSAFSSQTRGMFVYGGGLDYPILKHVAARVQYRGFVYKAPDFDVNAFNVDKTTHTAVPSIGLVFNF